MRLVRSSRGKLTHVFRPGGPPLTACGLQALRMSFIRDEDNRDKNDEGPWGLDDADDTISVRQGMPTCSDCQAWVAATILRYDRSPQEIEAAIAEALSPYKRPRDDR